MGEKNVTPKRMHQGGITLLVLPAYIPLPKTPLIGTHSTTDKKQTVQRRELPRIALIQIRNRYSGEGDEDIRSSWDVRVCVYRSFE
jgi:hypothetical protein